MANPVATTAYYCTGIRMLDAQVPRSLVGDTWAERFMDDDARTYFETFRSFGLSNAANLVRHHLIDEILKSRLAVDPRRRIVLLGAGFDSRALRFRGGEWFEVDEAPIIERKNGLAPPAQAPNPLTRIAVDFACDSISDKLATIATDAPMTVVMEGVLYYLEPDTLDQTLAALQRLFPRHELVCDLTSDVFVGRWGRPISRRIGEYGARFRFHPPDPARYIERLGYRLESAISVMLRASELRRVWIPAWVIRWLVPSLRDGYRVYVFSLSSPLPVNASFHRTRQSLRAREFAAKSNRRLIRSAAKYNPRHRERLARSGAPVSRLDAHPPCQRRVVGRPALHEVSGGHVDGTSL